LWGCMLTTPAGTHSAHCTSSTRRRMVEVSSALRYMLIAVSMIACKCLPHTKHNAGRVVFRHWPPRHPHVRLRHRMPELPAVHAPQRGWHKRQWRPRTSHVCAWSHYAPTAARTDVQSVGVWAAAAAIIRSVKHRHAPCAVHRCGDMGLGWRVPLAAITTSLDFFSCSWCHRRHHHIHPSYQDQLHGLYV
jgi:hypothetical protein